MCHDNHNEWNPTNYSGFFMTALTVQGSRGSRLTGRRLVERAGTESHGTNWVQKLFITTG